jgi:hypothetical protein
MANREQGSTAGRRRSDRRTETPRRRRVPQALRAPVARRSVLAGTIVVLVLAGTAAAAGGISIGSILPGDDTPGPPEYRQTDETVVALGVDPVIGRWRIVRYRSSELADRGEVLQPAGLPCLKLTLQAPAGGPPIGSRSWCGDRGQGGVAAASLPVRTPDGRVYTLLFGEAPEQAAAVEVANSDGMRRRVRLHEGPAMIESDFWMDVIPRGEPAGETWVEWSGADGRRPGERVDLTLELGQPLTPLGVGAG